jgi:MFS family permease
MSNISQSIDGGGATEVIESRAPFYLFCLATFLSFLGTSSIAFFSVVFAGYGMSVDQIGGIFSAALAPVVFGILFCGAFLTRVSPLQMALIGQAITLVAYASFFATLSLPTGALLSRLFVGAGFGLFFPAALIYARSLISGANTVFLFGIYSTMIPLPNFLGPGLAEFVYANWGAHALLWCFTVPIGLALIIMWFLPRSQAPVPSMEMLSYARIIRTRSTILANVAIAIVGLMWGFMLSFMALYLSAVRVPTAVFFSGATLSMVLSRFTIMAWLGKKPKEIVAGAGLIFMSIGYVLLPFCGSSATLVALSAIIFGFGYSTVFPVLSLWSTDEFAIRQRGRAMAVFTGVFQTAIFIVPILAGRAARFVGFDGILFTLAAVALPVGLYTMSRYAVGR